MISVKGVGTKVAIYWDFENIHASLFDEKNGPGAYHDYRAPHPEIVRLEPVMNFIALLGDIAVHRAYADWSRFRIYRYQLLQFSIDLIQLYPRGMRAKNGADIRIVLDAMEDVHHFPHIGHIVIVGGDSDYVGLAQKLRQAGKHVTGIGVQGFTNPYWERACNEFKYYKSLIAQSVVEADTAVTLEELKAESDVDAAKELIRRAVQVECNMRGRQSILVASLGHRLTRIDPTFDPINFGFRSLTEMLRSLKEIVYVEKGESDNLVGLLNPQHETVMSSSASCAEALNSTIKPPEVETVSRPSDDSMHTTEAENTNTYAKIIKNYHARIPNPEFKAEIVAALTRSFMSRSLMPEWADVDHAVADELAKASIICPMSEIRNVRNICLKPFPRLFKLEPNHGGIRLVQADAGSIIDAIDGYIISLLLKEVNPPLDRSALCFILRGTAQAVSTEFIAKIETAEYQYHRPAKTNVISSGEQGPSESK